MNTSQRQPLLTPDLEEAFAQDDADRRRFGPLFKAKTAAGEGPRLWREIETMELRIRELCGEKNIPVTDDRIRGFQQVADARYWVARQEETLESVPTIEALRSMRITLQGWVETAEELPPATGDAEAKKLAV